MASHYKQPTVQATYKQPLIYLWLRITSNVHYKQATSNLCGQASKCTQKATQKAPMHLMLLQCSKHHQTLATCINSFQNTSKMLPKGSKVHPKCLQNDPEHFHCPPNCFQKAPKAIQNAPNCIQIVKNLHVASKNLQNASICSKMLPKAFKTNAQCFQNPPQCFQILPQTTQMLLKPSKMIQNTTILPCGSITFLQNTTIWNMSPVLTHSGIPGGNP